MLRWQSRPRRGGGVVVVVVGSVLLRGLGAASQPRAGLATSAWRHLPCRPSPLHAARRSVRAAQKQAEAAAAERADADERFQAVTSELQEERAKKEATEVGAGGIGAQARGQRGVSKEPGTSGEQSAACPPSTAAAARFAPPLHVLPPTDRPSCPPKPSHLNPAGRAD